MATATSIIEALASLDLHGQQEVQRRLEEMISEAELLQTIERFETTYDGPLPAKLTDVSWSTNQETREYVSALTIEVAGEELYFDFDQDPDDSRRGAGAHPRYVRAVPRVSEARVRGYAGSPGP